MDFSQFDVRKYPTVSVQEGYREMHEGLIDEEWIARKPHWIRYLNRPISFAMVWQKER